jgi:hypothetical protein
MGHCGRKSLRESTTVALDPSLDLVVFVRREVVSMAENNITKCLVLAHGGDAVSMQSDIGGIGDQR